MCNQEGIRISRQNFNENLENLHLAPTLFYHISGFYLTTGFLNPHSLPMCVTKYKISSAANVLITYKSRKKVKISKQLIAKIMLHFYLNVNFNLPPNCISTCIF